MTNKLLMLAVCVLLSIVGCTGTDKTGNSNRTLNKQFPAFLAGTWEPNESKWIFTFEPNGTISKFQHFVGMEFIVAQGGLVEPWRNDAEAIYSLGPCEASYEPKTRQLSVKIVIEHYVIKFINGSMEGSFHDTLVGPVSEDGKIWNASWISTCEITGHGTDTMKPKMLIFTKVSDKTSK